jgi:hypothetical protein
MKRIVHSCTEDHGRLYDPAAEAPNANFSGAALSRSSGSVVGDQFEIWSASVVAIYINRSEKSFNNQLFMRVTPSAAACSNSKFFFFLQLRDGPSPHPSAPSRHQKSSRCLSAFPNQQQALQLKWLLPLLSDPAQFLSQALLLAAPPPPTNRTRRAITRSKFFA